MSTNDKELETIYPQGVEIFIGNEKIMIKPFVLKNRTMVVRLIAQIFTELAVQPDMAKIGNFDVIGRFIDVGGDRLVAIYELVTGKDKDWLSENLLLKQEVELLTTIIEINDFPFLIGQVKKMMGTKQLP